MVLPKSLTTVTTFSKTIAMILFVLLPFAGFYLGYNFAKTSESNPIIQNNPISTPAITSAPSSTTDSTANWKTYSNSKFSYSFKYPKEFEVSSGVEGLPGNEGLRQIETTAVINVGEGRTTYLQITALNETKSLDQVKQDLISDTKAKVSDMTNVTVAGEAGLGYQYNGYSYSTLVKNNVRYDFYLSDKTIAEQILSIFRFD